MSKDFNDSIFYSIANKCIQAKCPKCSRRFVAKYDAKLNMDIIDGLSTLSMNPNNVSIDIRPVFKCGICSDHPELYVTDSTFERMLNVIKKLTSSMCGIKTYKKCTLNSNPQFRAGSIVLEYCTPELDLLVPVSKKDKLEETLFRYLKDKSMLINDYFASIIYEAETAENDHGYYKARFILDKGLCDDIYFCQYKDICGYEEYMNNTFLEKLNYLALLLEEASK